jgi:probable phosphoglycerate mutase
MTEILMVRHGQSVWNAEGRWQGRANPPLSPLGVAQAESAGLHLAKLAAQAPFDAVASSSLNRAATTGAIIAKHLGLADTYKTPDLAERDAGEWSGLTSAEIEVRYPGYIKGRKYPPGYEHDDVLLARVHRGLRDAIANTGAQRLLITAHGGIIYCIESSVGRPFRHLANLGALSFEYDSRSRSFVLGERVELLIDFDEETTTPGQL